MAREVCGHELEVGKSNGFREVVQRAAGAAATSTIRGFLSSSLPWSVPIHSNASLRAVCPGRYDMQYRMDTPPFLDFKNALWCAPFF
jgi:hypothetical protein